MTRARFAYLDSEQPIAFAHRGGAHEHPENTLPAFEAAVRLGYRYLETDVHATADGVLLAFHDDRLDRVTDRSGIIRALPYAEVKQARVAGAEPIPLLEELLGSFPGVRVNIDAKADHSVHPLISALRRTNSLDRVCLGAFSHKRLQRMRAILGPDVCTSASPVEVLRVRVGRSPGPGPACLQVPVRHGRMPVTDARFVATAHKLGLPVHVWTVDDEAEMDRLLDLGADGIMTDRPHVLKQVLERRGHWPAG
ncbi:MAG TPA: glycerophosphodiester phosphodiesterase [Acidimicrobiales bacterium]